MKAGVQAIIQKINEEAGVHGIQRYDRLKKEIDRELENQTALFMDEIDKNKDMLIRHNQRELSRMTERQSRRLNRELLLYQHSLLDEIFHMTVLKLREISGKEFSDMFFGAVKDLKGEFTLRIGELSLGKLDMDRVKGLQENGLSIEVSGTPIPGKSGFLLADGRVEYSYLFEDLVEDKKSEQMALILKEVFE